MFFFGRKRIKALESMIAEQSARYNQEIKQLNEQLMCKDNDILILESENAKNTELIAKLSKANSQISSKLIDKNNEISVLNEEAANTERQLKVLCYYIEDIRKSHESGNSYDMVSAKEAAALIDGLSVYYVRKLIHDGKIKSVRDKGKFLISKKAFFKYALTDEKIGA